jgi:hypothetical protein
MPNELLFNNSRTYMVREFGLGNQIRTIEDMFSEALEKQQILTMPRMPRRLAFKEISAF